MIDSVRVNVELRTWDASDAAWYAEATKDPEVQRYTTESPDLTEEQVAAAIAALPGNQGTDSFIVVDGDTGERYGNVAVDFIDGVGHMSYLMAPRARGRGVAGTALTQFVAWIFANRAVRELRLWTHSDNVPSRKVAERAGFVRDAAQDKDREIKGAVWRTVAYRLVRD
ncbi:GNAT family N-acetyltransferase [Lentzea sp. NPDC059081]|uniref:GNAT family N-acetyltransferase n=1 Tax=Lentzea sp. NPDC059081 TaxID=3346719 RepID=UPI0036B071F2